MKTKFTFLLAAGLFFAVASQAQYHDSYAGQRDIRHDKREIYQDRQDLKRNYNYGYSGSFHQDRRDLIRDRRDLYFDRHDRRFNHRWEIMRHRKFYY